MQVPDPTGMSFPQWALGLLTNFDIADVPLTPTEGNWKEFMVACRDLNSAFSEVPEPWFFSDWQTYARATALLVG